MKYELLIFCIAALILLGGCPLQPPATDPCEGITCSNKCEGTTRLTNGVCEDGNCHYTETQNSTECGYVVDLCAGVTCQDKCVGTTRLIGGVCSGGQCTYAETQNSAQCGYIEPETGLELDVKLQACMWDGVARKYELFFTIKNVGDEIPEYDGSIWVVGPGITNRSFEIIQEEYERNEIMWAEKRWSYPWLWQGNIWEIKNVDYNSSIDFQLIYCDSSLDWQFDDCTAGIGQVLYESNILDINCTT